MKVLLNVSKLLKNYLVRVCLAANVVINVKTARQNMKAVFSLMFIQNVSDLTFYNKKLLV